MKRAALALLVGAAGCSNILGIDTFTSNGGDDASVADAPATTFDAPVDATAFDAGPPDANLPDAMPIVCDPVGQTGCNTGEKCTWIRLTVGTTPTGEIGCVPNGNVGAGVACTWGTSGAATGYDNCQKGLVCRSKNKVENETGKCEAICDPSVADGTPRTCTTGFSCGVYSGYFTTGVSQPATAGLCDPICNPLNDNDFGTGSKPGTTCGTGEGCYGYPRNDPNHRTAYTCENDYNPTLYHRSDCTSANGCATSGGGPYTNGCGSGFMPIIKDDQLGFGQFVCAALCKPLDCYSGNCGASNVNRPGGSPHRCQNPDAMGTFDNVADGEHCTYLWLYEEDQNGVVPISPFSNTVGVCLDHQHIHLPDASGNPSNTPYPACATLPATSPQPNCTAADQSGCSAALLGCVNSTTANVQTELVGKRPPPIGFPRAPYHLVVHP